VCCQQLHNSLRDFDFGIGKYRYLILDMLPIYPPKRSSRVGALVKPLPPFLGLEPENVIVRRLITQLVLTDCYCPPPTHIQYSTYTHGKHKKSTITSKIFLIYVGKTWESVSISIKFIRLLRNRKKKLEAWSLALSKLLENKNKIIFTSTLCNSRNNR
jgi:hypothetical protein